MVHDEQVGAPLAASSATGCAGSTASSTFVDRRVRVAGDQADGIPVSAVAGGYQASSSPTTSATLTPRTWA